MILLLLLAITTRMTRALIGFDCGGQHLNVTSISLLEAGDCSTDIQPTNSSNTFIQLLQLSDYNYAEVIQCKVEISRTVYHCGMHSHISVVFNGQAEYLEEINNERCSQLHKEGTLRIGETTYINGVKPNSTSAHGATLAGTISLDGACKGLQYIDHFGTWDDVVVQAIIRITIRSSYAPVHLGSGKIILGTGTTCQLRDGFCIDPDNGHTFWKPMPISSCDFHQYDVLYEGIATKTQGKDAPLIYSLVTQDITFALTATSTQPLCGYTLLRTEHPKLFVLETTKNDVVKRKSVIPINNLDIFTYVNSKFVYVEKHIRSQMTSLYHNVIQQKCQMEREILKNILSIAKLLPDEFAYRLMKGPGYMSVVAGEAAHIIKCIPVDVTVRKTKECYAELPVTVRNSSVYMTPKSRIVTKYGTQRECSNELPILYNIEDTWVQFVPEPQVRQVPPQQLRPMTRMTWKYLTPGSLATSGIYSKQDIDKLRDHTMFPQEKPAVLNSVARGITGLTTGTGTASMYNLLSKEDLNKLAENAAHRIWSGFISFGSATAGIFGIFVIIRLVKIIIDTAIHDYALHMAYGCSLHLIGAVWSSLTHLLLHLARGPPKPKVVNPDNLINDDDDPENPPGPSSQTQPTAPPNTPVKREADVTQSQPTAQYNRAQGTTQCNVSLYNELLRNLNKVEHRSTLKPSDCSSSGGTCNVSEKP